MINSWIDTSLENEIREIFEPLYKRELTENEIDLIGNGLANIAELWVKFSWRINHAK